MSLDGLEFVLSRTGILDIFLMFFVLAAFGCILIDRDVSRARLAEAVVRARGIRRVPSSASASGGYWRPVHRPGLCRQARRGLVHPRLRRAVVAWDIGARRAAGLKSFVRGGIVRDGSGCRSRSS